MRLRRPSLLVKFSLLSLLVIVALGVAIGSALHQRIERRGLAQAMHLADVMTRVGVQSALRPSDLSGPLTRARLDELDAELRRSDFPDLQISRVKLYDHRGKILYSDDRAIIGQVHAASGELQSALGGRIAGEVEAGTDEDGHGARTLEVYVPVRLRATGQPSAVFEVYLPYEPVAAAIGADSARLYLLLARGWRSVRPSA